MKIQDLPELKVQPRLSATLSVRLSRADRRRIDTVAKDLGVTVGRLARVIVMRALDDEEVDPQGEVSGDSSK